MDEKDKRLAWYFKKYGPYVEKRGLHNWKNLFAKPNNYEWTILFLLLMVGFITWAYIAETGQCKEVLDNIEGICLNYNQNYSSSVVNLSQISLSQIDVSLSMIKADNQSLNDS